MTVQRSNRNSRLPTTAILGLSVMAFSLLHADSFFVTGSYRVPRQASNATTPTPISAVSAGSVVLSNPGSMYQIYSSGFAYGQPLVELATWDFVANGCLLNATCPCLSIPASKDCIPSYLRLKTGYVADIQRFCGTNMPINFTSSSELHIRYKSSPLRPARGFTCYVSCTLPGMVPPTAVPNATCPTPM